MVENEHVEYESDVVGPVEEEFVEVLLQEFMDDIKSLVNGDELEGLIQTP